MLEAGEDPRFIARRVVSRRARTSGWRTPRPSAGRCGLHALEMIGMPEARMMLAQAVVHIALAPKSNAADRHRRARPRTLGRGGAAPRRRISRHGLPAQAVGRGDGTSTLTTTRAGWYGSIPARWPSMAIDCVPRAGPAGLRSSVPQGQDRQSWLRRAGGGGSAGRLGGSSSGTDSAASPSHERRCSERGAPWLRPPIRVVKVRTAPAVPFRADPGSRYGGVPDGGVRQRLASPRWRDGGARLARGAPSRARRLWLRTAL